MSNTHRFLRGVALFAALAAGCASAQSVGPIGPVTPAHHHRLGSKSNTTETDLLGLWLNATPVANVADNAASSPLTNLWIGFNTADPGEAGDCTTNEATFTGYARTAIARSNGSPQWTISSPSGVGTAKNTNAITGPTYTVGGGSPQTLTYFEVCTASSGAAKIIYSGALTNSLIVNPGITVNVAALALVITED